MSNIRARKLPTQVQVKRSDPVYMAHAYLTKVPIPAIRPYIEEFTNPGDVVLDPFAGSGMTGVAAIILGRNAELFDVSVLGRHIGLNYARRVNSDVYRTTAKQIVGDVDRELSFPYRTTCSKCGRPAVTSKVTRSVVVKCPSCGSGVSYYRSLEAADWRKSATACPTCGEAITSKARRVGESPETETVRCDCSSKLFDQEGDIEEWDRPTDVNIPSAEITPDRQMYVASALGKHGLTSTSSFFSPRNATVLATMRERIGQTPDEDICQKLLFAFTAILTRASKRYQWSRERPLNAANANYYVAPVFYEWNVFELFERKIEAIIRSDEYISTEKTKVGVTEDLHMRYRIASATNLPLPDNSVDYVFTDPPFGWNIFYSDMNLFHEAWLGEEFTDPAMEAVIDRTKNGDARTPERYEQMLIDSLRECRRVLKPGGWITIVFGSSSGSVWAVVQRAIARAGLRIDPDTIASLHKGQRSVKGLASGFENVVTHDLIMSICTSDPATEAEVHEPAPNEVREVVMNGLEFTRSPSELYVWLLREGLRGDWDLSALHLRDVTKILIDEGFSINGKTGDLTDADRTVA